jgi:alanyl-tRNA synthetase
MGSGVVVLASDSDGRVNLVVSVTKDLTARLQAGRIVKELAPIVGGAGGGRPDFAEAGGKDPAKIDQMLSTAPEVVRALLG